jgi:hypothetical protein
MADDPSKEYCEMSRGIIIISEAFLNCKRSQGLILKAEEGEERQTI